MTKQSIHDFTYEDKQAALDEAWALMSENWVLMLKESVSKKHHEGKAMFLSDDDSNGFLTDNLQKAEVFLSKEETICRMKAHEKDMKHRYGKDAVCNFGYTNIMRNFEFIKVEFVEELK